MNILFIHSHRFRKIDNNIFSSGGLSEEVLKRYIDQKDNITVMARIQEENKNTGDNYSEITDHRINILNIFDEKLKGLKEKIKQADFVIIRLPCIVGNIAIRYVRKYHKKCIVEVVACVWDSYWNHGLTGKILAPILYFITKKNIMLAPNVLYVSDEFLQKRYPTKGNAIACSDVNLKEVDKEILENKVRNAKKINKDSKIVLATVAAVNVKYKGQQYVLKLIKDMKKQGYNIEYKLIGGGDNKYLKSLVEKYNIEKEVVFLGAVKHDEVFEILKTVDIYIQPSLQEGLCRALIEAMSVGCCCIASNAGGNTELLDSEFIFKKKRVKELEKIIKKLINDNTLIQKACERNYEYSKKYDNKNTEKLRNEFYLEVKRGKR